MSVQVISDIHLEFRNELYSRIIRPQAPILILAGDICPAGDCLQPRSPHFTKLIDFLTWCSRGFRYVIYVPGNHEYYSEVCCPMPVINKAIKDAVRPLGNVYFLQNGMIKLSIGSNNRDVLFAGTTLWSKLAPAHIHTIMQTMNDYTAIYTTTEQSAAAAAPLRERKRMCRLLLPSDVLAMHQQALRFVAKAQSYARAQSLPLVMISHHKPTCGGRNGDVCGENGLASAYETNLTSIMGPPTVLWVHGHTHRHNDQKIRGTRVYSNAYGYPQESTGHESTIIRITLAT